MKLSKGGDPLSGQNLIPVCWPKEHAEILFAGVLPTTLLLSQGWIRMFSLHSHFASDSTWKVLTCFVLWDDLGTILELTRGGKAMPRPSDTPRQPLSLNYTVKAKELPQCFANPLGSGRNQLL